MKKNTHLFYLLICFFISFAFFSCKQNDTEEIPPSLSVKFIDNSELKDTSAQAGQSIVILVEASAGSENITYFSMTSNGVHVLDSGLNASSFTSQRIIVKNTDSLETYTIWVRDKNFKSASLSFSIALLPTVVYGNIRTFDIALGAQNNTALGGFLNLFSGQVYNLNQAFLAQDSVQMLYFYDGSDLNTIASPNANIDTSYFPGNDGLFHWTIKNEIRYVELFISEQNFLDCQNDSLIIAQLFPYENGKRKAKYLEAGDIYEFCYNGKYGIFYVNSVSGTDAGSINIRIKIQE